MLSLVYLLPFRPQLAVFFKFLSVALFPSYVGLATSLECIMLRVWLEKLSLPLKRLHDLWEGGIETESSFPSHTTLSTVTLNYYAHHVSVLSRCRPYSRTVDVTTSFGFWFTLEILLPHSSNHRGNTNMRYPILVSFLKNVTSDFDYELLVVVVLFF